MKINWKVRFRNPVFLGQLLLTVFGPVLVYYGLVPTDITSFPALIELLKDAFSNPFVIGTMIYGFYNAVTDPVTAGLSDSRQALTYDKPKDDRWKGMK
ncbi:phage holin [Sporosarcina sp. P33]|uniref:phage holin n=1 Tax=Sporosarcina sp. P33 TaxID=1930764 RepID=UPI0009BF14C3|nr:phage holin [Sporosarcina sp. P33]ARD47555.1 hypothetical protein SporoP33_04430 [Sporosarcina sp. P33]